MKVVVQALCFNNAFTLSSALCNLPRTLPGVNQISVLVVDLGSRDRTQEVAKLLGFEVLKVPVAGNRARGFLLGTERALQMGADIVVTLSGDYDWSGGTLHKLVEPIQCGHMDVTVAARKMAPELGFSWQDRFFRKVGRRLFRIMFRLTAFDPYGAASGIAFRARAARKLSLFTKHSYAAEILIHAARNKFKVLDVHVRARRLIYQRGPGPLGFLGSWLRLLALYQPLRSMVLLGIVFLGVGIFSILGPNGGSVSRTVFGSSAFILGFISFSVGLILDQLAASRQEQGRGQEAAWVPVVSEVRAPVKPRPVFKKGDRIKTALRGTQKKLSQVGKPKVLFDCTELASGQTNFRARTGVHRVVESLALGIESRSDICLTYLGRNAPELRMIEGALQSLKLTPKERCLNLQVLSGEVASPETFKRLTLKPKALKWLNDQANNEIARVERLSRTGLKDFDIYHSPYADVPAVVRETKSIRKFVTVHDLIPILMPELFPPGERPINRITRDARPEDWFFTVSQSTKNDLCNHAKQIDANQVVVAPLAADPDRFKPVDDTEVQRIRKKFKIGDARYFLSLATLEPRKNILRTVQCFRELLRQEKEKDLVLVLTGEMGWMVSDLIKLIEGDRLLRKKVIRTGFVADRDLAGLYGGALGFVYPSYYEGFGLPPLEAMSCGTPVIVSNTSSMPEVVGRAGILVPPRDSDAISEAMLQVLRSPSLRDQMSRGSLERARHFSWKKTSDIISSTYRRALELN